jgi:hypothetical protein
MSKEGEAGSTSVSKHCKSLNMVRAFAVKEEAIQHNCYSGYLGYPFTISNVCISQEESFLLSLYLIVTPGLN